MEMSYTFHLATPCVVLIASCYDRYEDLVCEPVVFSTMILIKFGC